MKKFPVAFLTAGLALSAHTLLSHEVGHDNSSSNPGPAPYPLPAIVENTGPVHRPAPVPGMQALRTSGQGFWTFTAATNGVMMVPEAVKPFVKGAHGTIIVDGTRDVAYWGLEKAGWIAFSDKLTQSRVIQGDPLFAAGNLHGADIQSRPGLLPLVVVADNVRGDVYVSDTAFQHAQSLGWPTNGPYQSRDQYHPTDAAFGAQGDAYVTDGYGASYILPISTSQGAYRGSALGGKGMSQTPHGIAYDARGKALLVAARPEGLIKRWSLNDRHWESVLGLPKGSTVCDVELWGDYALVPCLDGPENSPGPIYIVNMRKKAIVSTIRPKEDLGYADAQHIHDAAWYFIGKGKKREVYILFTNWNPGGIGALKLSRVQP